MEDGTIGKAYGYQIAKQTLDIKVNLITLLMKLRKIQTVEEL